MPALTPSFLFDFEKNMSIITEDEYARFSRNLWWQSIMKVRPSSKKAERIAWLLSTAKIEDLGQGGNMVFEDLVSTSVEYVNKNSGAGLKLQRNQLEDNDGDGFDLASKWSGDIGKYMAYWPQKQATALLKNGHITTGPGGAAYDSKAFFATDHPLNPFNTGLGTYANLFTGGTAADISDAVTVDVAYQNLAKVYAAILSVKMPNGEDPRFLTPVQLLVPPKLQARATLLTSAKFIGTAAATGGGSSDVEKVISRYGWREPIVVPELAGFESETTFFVAVEEAGNSQLGSLVYVDREPFKITYYTGNGGGTGVDAVLDRARELEWHCQGRNVSAYGFPYMLYKVKAG